MSGHRIISLMQYTLNSHQQRQHSCRHPTGSKPDRIATPFAVDICSVSKGDEASEECEGADEEASAEGGKACWFSGGQCSEESGWSGEASV
jgi:hypothetical protein